MSELWQKLTTRSNAASGQNGSPMTFVRASTVRGKVLNCTSFDGDEGNGTANGGGGTASLLKWQQEKLRKENKMAAPFCDKIHVSYKGIKRVEISYLY